MKPYIFINIITYLQNFFILGKEIRRLKRKKRGIKMLDKLFALNSNVGFIRAGEDRNFMLFEKKRNYRQIICWNEDFAEETI